MEDGMPISLWRKPLNIPGSAILRINQPIVQTVLPALPEFEAVRRQAKAAPEIGQRDLIAEFLL